MIHFLQPARTDKNLGKAYNDSISLIPDGDWICLIDRDMLFIQDNYLDIIYQAVEDNKEVGVLTCYTNRVGNLEQCWEGRKSEDPNMINHYLIGQKVSRLNKGSYTVLDKQHISGLVMIFKKKTWEEVGGFKDGIFVDNHFTHRVSKMGKPVVRIDSLYVYHFYRKVKGCDNAKHLGVNSKILTRKL